MFTGIDLFSDTVTRPSPAMRRAMVEAEVGDEQLGEDPTTRALEEKIAELLGFSSALFLPSATMANQIAVQLHCSPGDEVIAAAGSHLYGAEAGGAAVHARVMSKEIVTANGIFSAQELKKQVSVLRGPHFPVSKLLLIENTFNFGGGVVWPLPQLRAVITEARLNSLKCHLDGARLFNAVVRLNGNAKDIAAQFDTATVCLSKGLGAPMGALLCLNKALWGTARRLKQLMGGAMRQSGILSAAGLFALENNIARLSEDHENARRFAEGLTSVKSLMVENSQPETNMVYFQWRSSKLSADEFESRSTRAGVRFCRMGETRFRAVTHLDVNRDAIDKAIGIIQAISKEA